MEHENHTLNVLNRAAHSHVFKTSCVCVCVCERERECVCVCVRERERETPEVLKIIIRVIAEAAVFIFKFIIFPAESVCFSLSLNTHLCIKHAVETAVTGTMWKHTHTHTHTLTLFYNCCSLFLHTLCTL